MHLISRRQFFTALLAATLLVGTALSASARPITGVVAFGDSLTDTGNAAAVVNAVAPFTFPAPLDTFGRPAYAPGRLSNGATWIEGFVSGLGLPTASLDNRAYAGAFTNQLNTVNPLLVASGAAPDALGMQDQVAEYLSGTPVNPDNLYVLWGGANNYFSGETNPFNPVNDIAAQIDALALGGATQFLVVNLPDLGSTPGGSIAADGLNQLTAAHNSILDATLAGIRTARPTVDLRLFDVNTLFKQVIANPTDFGLTDPDSPYVLSGTLNGQVTQGFQPTIIDDTEDVNDYLFFDEIHPTAAAHSIIANRALTVVVPEGSTAGLLGAGCSLLGAGIVLRRRRKA